MMSLEEEISHLQKENSQVDSQLHRIKSDVGGMETDASSEDKVRDKLQQAEPTSDNCVCCCCRRVQRSSGEMPNSRIITRTSEQMFSRY